jgi:hypothetical protein
VPFFARPGQPGSAVSYASRYHNVIGGAYVPPVKSQYFERGAGAGGKVEVPVYIGRQQFANWWHTHLTIDVVPGRGAGFSLEAPEGFRYLTRSRLFHRRGDGVARASGAAGAGRVAPGLKLRSVLGPASSVASHS